MTKIDNQNIPILVIYDDKMVCSKLASTAANSLKAKIYKSLI